MCHRQPLIERADPIEMGNGRTAKHLVALQELALGLAHVHMDHDVELLSQLGTALKLGHRAAVPRGPTIGVTRCVRRRTAVAKATKSSSDSLPSSALMRATSSRALGDKVLVRGPLWRRIAGPTASAPNRRACRHPPSRPPHAARPYAGSASRCRNDPSRQCSRCGSFR